MAKRAVSLNIVIEATQAQMENENEFRNLCIQRMCEILNSDNQVDSFAENVSTEIFDENVSDEPDELVEDFLINQEYGL